MSTDQQQSEWVPEDGDKVWVYGDDNDPIQQLIWDGDDRSCRQLWANGNVFRTRELAEDARDRKNPRPSRPRYY